MEAANLGAWLSGRSTEELDHALLMLASEPSFRPDIGAWAKAAFDVIETFPDGAESLVVKTWHYGHEPPNAFDTQTAKYFHHAPRATQEEDRVGKEVANT